MAVAANAHCGYKVGALLQRIVLSADAGCSHRIDRGGACSWWAAGHRAHLEEPSLPVHSGPVVGAEGRGLVAADEAGKAEQRIADCMEEVKAMSDW